MSEEGGGWVGLSGHCCLKRRQCLLEERMEVWIWAFVVVGWDTRVYQRLDLRRAIGLLTLGQKCGLGVVVGVWEWTLVLPLFVAGVARV